MASAKQLAANRLNAKRSTGPKGEAGKSRSSKNALKHGLTAREIVIRDEDPDQFDALRAGLDADFKPSTTIERELIDRLAGLLWRLRRAVVLEADLLRPSRGIALDFERLTRAELEQFEKLATKIVVDQDETPAAPSDKSAPVGDNEKIDRLGSLSRYETRLMNDVTRTLNLLHILQTSRLAAAEDQRTIEAAPAKDPSGASQ